MVLNSLERWYNTKTYTYSVTFVVLKALSLRWPSRSVEVHNASLRLFRERSNIPVQPTLRGSAAFGRLTSGVSQLMV